MPAPPTIKVTAPDLTTNSDMLDNLNLLIDGLQRCFVAGRLDTLAPEEWCDMASDLRRAADLYEKYGSLLIQVDVQARDGVAGGASG